MAHDISHDFLRRLALPHYPLMHARIALYPVIRRVRKFSRGLRGKGVSRNVSPVSITETFESTQEAYRKAQWAWINPVFPDSFWHELVAHWPTKDFFDPPRMITKSYDVGFKWNRGDGLPTDIERFPEVKVLLEYLMSVEWTSRLQKYIGTEKKMGCNSFLLNETYPGSCVIPHRDDPLPDGSTPFINMIFCIDGTGGGNSGELILSRDPNQDDILFTPPTLKNACLVYDTGADFYHGFPPVASGTRRFVITASFSPEQN